MAGRAARVEHHARRPRHRPRDEPPGGLGEDPGKESQSLRRQVAVAEGVAPAHPSTFAAPGASSAVPPRELLPRHAEQEQVMVLAPGEHCPPSPTLHDEAEVLVKVQREAG